MTTSEASVDVAGQHALAKGDVTMFRQDHTHRHTCTPTR